MRPKYPGAQHMFDVQAFKVPLKLAEADGGQIIDVQTHQPFVENDSCVERGPTVGYNEVAATKAREVIRALVTTVLKP
jgi:hypothetical protein